MRGGIEEELAALKHEQWRLETVAELEMLKARPGCRVQDLGLRGCGVGFIIEDLGFRFEGVGLRMEDVGFRVEGLGLRMEGVGFRI
jgi:hypothetical protein